MIDLTVTLTDELMTGLELAAELLYGNDLSQAVADALTARLPVWAEAAVRQSVMFPDLMIDTTGNKMALRKMEGLMRKEPDDG